MEDRNQRFVDRTTALIATGVESQVPDWAPIIDTLRKLSRTEHVRMSDDERSALNRYIHHATQVAVAIELAETARQDFEAAGMMRRFKQDGSAPKLQRGTEDPGDLAEMWEAGERVFTHPYR